MRRRRVAAHAQHFIPQSDETLIVVPQVASLGGAAGRTILGLEIKHQLLASKIAQLHHVAILVVALEIGRRSSNL